MTQRLTIPNIDHDLQPQSSWGARKPPSIGEAAANAALRAHAAITAASIIETRANRYALYPRELDALEIQHLTGKRRLSEMPPRQLRNRIAVLIGEELEMPRRIGGEPMMINLRAAAVYSERLCDLEAAQARENAGKYAGSTL